MGRIIPYIWWLIMVNDFKWWSGWWLSPTPLKNMSSSVGMMTFPIYGKITNVPNHQPAFDLFQKDSTHVPRLVLPIIPSKRWCIFSYVVLSRYIFMAVHRRQGVTRVPPKLGLWTKTNAECIVHGVQLFRKRCKISILYIDMIYLYPYLYA